jgi:hypothetical protein
MSSASDRAFLCAWFLLICLFCDQPSPAVQSQTNAGAAASPTPGAFVIKPQFERAGQFSEGLAAVQVSGAGGLKWGYIDKSGNFVIQPRFEDAEEFSEGLAAVRVGAEGTSGWGFIDRSGRIAIGPNWDHVSSFSRGLAIVRTGNEFTGRDRVIDKRGVYVSDLKSGTVVPCGNGLTLVGVTVGWVEGGVKRHYGFVDEFGTYVIKPAFDDAFCFTEGMAAVRVGDEVLGKWGFIDRTGTFVIEPRWGFAFPFRDGIATVAHAGGVKNKWGAIDRTGLEIIPLQYPEPLHFDDGLAPVSVTTFKWGTDEDGRSKLLPDTKYSFVDENGSRPISLEWSAVSSFSQGLAPVMIGDPRGGKWGYIDKGGRFVVNPRFDDARPFSEGMAAVLIRANETERWGYIWCGEIDAVEVAPRGQENPGGRSK